MDFIDQMESHFKIISENLFSKICAHEEAKLSLHAENSLFVRYNQAKVRQNTSIAQIELRIELVSDNKSVKKGLNLTGDLETDLDRSQNLLAQARREIPELDFDPRLTALQKFDSSTAKFKSSTPLSNTHTADLLNLVGNSDLAGIWSSGPVVKAASTSKGTFHFYGIDSFCLDYSLFSGPKSVKGVFAGIAWDEAKFNEQMLKSKKSLALLERPAASAPRGNYRVYLAPAALNEIINIMNWDALSQDAFQNGNSPFTRLVKEEVQVSPRFHLRENFELGLSPRFNESGESAPGILPIIDAGKVKNLLTSTRTANQYSLKSNQAEEGEVLRAPELLTGNLEENDILRALGTGIYISNLHYLNWSDRLSARITGMTRFACFWVEKGEILGPISDLRFDVSLYDILGDKLEQLTSQSEWIPSTTTYGGRSLGGAKTPGVLISDFKFTL